MKSYVVEGVIERVCVCVVTALVRRFRWRVKFTQRRETVRGGEAKRKTGQRRRSRREVVERARRAHRGDPAKTARRLRVGVK